MSTNISNRKIKHLTCTMSKAIALYLPSVEFWIQIPVISPMQRCNNGGWMYPNKLCTLPRVWRNYSVYIESMGEGTETYTSCMLCWCISFWANSQISACLSCCICWGKWPCYKIAWLTYFSILCGMHVVSTIVVKNELYYMEAGPDAQLYIMDLHMQILASCM